MRTAKSFRRATRRSFKGRYTKGGVRRKMRAIRKGRNSRHRKSYPTASRGGFRF